ncbi:MAG: HEAT repeat domain-containing protein [Prolixibacteraceae bacterium]|nr:HEAT repeat domain-containing protein [Prolixibacteraceae bacterium]MBN2772900.1 HEAT repeat domain-containing protein [Prolixibacteraceae bacterium]
MNKKKDHNKFDGLIENQSFSEKEKAEMRELFHRLDEVEVPEPSEAMKAGFYEKLEEYKLKNSVRRGIRFKWPELSEIFSLRSFLLRPAFAVIIFLIGIIGGMLINNNRQANKQLVAELQNSQKNLMLTLLEQPSVTQRLKAVNLTNELKNPDEMVINALFTTLNNDENANVRLAALETLFRYATQPEVRQGLIESISFQDSPLVLVTLSKAMVLLQEKNSVNKLKELLDNKNLDGNVKAQINENIQKLI